MISLHEYSAEGRTFLFRATSSRIFAWAKAVSFPDLAAWNARPSGASGHSASQGRTPQPIFQLHHNSLRPVQNQLIKRGCV